MEFIGAKSKGVMEMLANKNKDISKAFDILTVMSKNEKARMAYEAREAEIHDQLTREKVAREEGIEIGVEMENRRKALEDATNLLELGVSEETIAKGIGLPLEEVIALKKSMGV